MKNRLLQAMKSLPMLTEDKEKFVDIIINKSNSGGSSKLGYLYFRNIPGDAHNYPILDLFQKFEFIGLLFPVVKINNNKVLPLLRAMGGSGMNSSNVGYIRIEKIIASSNFIPFYDLINVFIEEGVADIDKSIINIMKENEITEAEFLEGAEFGVPQM